MAHIHPRTGRLTDPGVPELRMLLANGVPEPLQAALGPEGVTVVDSRPTQVLAAGATPRGDHRREG